ncbi:MAG: methyltransferase domain-containing protein [Thermodesulfobacteriota bacterium]
MLETVWGDGFLSPGGPTEVAMVLEGTDISGQQVLDIGCGTGGADILLINKYQAAHVIGIDVEEPVLEQSRQRASLENLSERIAYRLVEPGPLPFADESFDVVFSKDAMIHIPDKASLFKDVFRVLTTGGIFMASDWMRCDATPPSEDMQNYIRTEGLSFDMAPPENYAAALQEAGFEDITLRDRNPWYAELARNEYDQMKGPLYQTLVERAGQAETDRCIEVWRTMCVVLDSGELRPGHMRAVKPFSK